MGWNDRNKDVCNVIITCQHCNEKYSQYKEEQITGNRDMDYDICPYCDNVNGKSMSYEFHNKRI